MISERAEIITKEQTKCVLIASTGNVLIDHALIELKIRALSKGINMEVIVRKSIDGIINNYLTQTELQTLLCDHIKNSIIAIESSETESGKILIVFDGDYPVYSIAISDNGIQFNPEIINKLGLEPVSSHKDTGGTGMGFFTSFETLKKCRASIIISEYKDNIYSKKISFIFDGKNDFIIKTHRYNELTEAVKRSDIKILEE